MKIPDECFNARGLVRGRSVGDSRPDVEVPDDWDEEEDGPFEARSFRIQSVSKSLDVANGSDR